MLQYIDSIKYGCDSVELFQWAFNDTWNVSFEEEYWQGKSSLSRNAQLVTGYDDDFFVLVCSNFKWKLRVKHPSDERWFWPVAINPEVSCDLFILLPLWDTSKTLKQLSPVTAWNGGPFTLTAHFSFFFLYFLLSSCRRAWRVILETKHRLFKIVGSYFLFLEYSKNFYCFQYFTAETRQSSAMLI